MHAYRHRKLDAVKVTLVGHTVAVMSGMRDASGKRWEAAGPRASDLSEFAGRACYQSWSRPNPATASNEGYIGRIWDEHHWSVLEHGSVSFHFADVSRSYTHEQIRHRHFSYSQLSQRFVPVAEAKPVVPPLFRGNESAENLVSAAWQSSVFYYEALLERAKIATDTLGLTGFEARKRQHEATRCVLPNMTETSIVVTGNHRAWIEFLLQRGAVAADLEIREVAFEVLRQLTVLEPNIYCNLRVEGSGVFATVVEVRA